VPRDLFLPHILKSTVETSGDSLAESQIIEPFTFHSYYFYSPEGLYVLGNESERAIVYFVSFTINDGRVWSFRRRPAVDYV
jgi:hypothetical protein